MPPYIMSKGQQQIEKVGALVHYLSPHSPDFHPIEETFSNI